MSALDTYFEKSMALLQSLKANETENIRAAAALCADRISKGGLVFLLQRPFPHDVRGDDAAPGLLHRLGGAG